MNYTAPLYRRTPAITGIAALGLVTTVMLAPTAHADTERDRPDESASTAVVADVDGAAGAAGGEMAAEAPREAVTGTDEDAAAPETGDQAAAGTSEGAASEAGDELLVDTEAGPVEAGPVEADPADETAAAGNSEQDDLCADGTADDATRDQQAAEAGPAAVTDAELKDGTAEDGTAEEGTDVEVGLSDAAPTGEGAVTNPDCAATTPGQVDKDPGARDGDETQLPVGGVDAGRGEAASENMVLPIATAGAAAAAIGLGAYTLVRRRRSDA